uniref:Dipeptidase n=1 Tax=Oncorhynchus kisutch TaxID=8019 RepID=A0A8C7G0T9_ONCKI
YCSGIDLHFSHQSTFISRTQNAGTRHTKDDLPWQMRMKFNSQLNTVDLYTLINTHTNIPKIREGRLAAQVHTPYVPCETQYKDAARQILEQIVVIHRMCMKYPEAFMFASSSKGESHLQKKSSLIGESGREICLPEAGRVFYCGCVCFPPRADNWLHNGLSEFGKQLVFEMNCIGMLIDLAHVSEKVMNQVLDLSKAPVIFSHSSAYAVCPHKRNVSDDVLRKVVRKGSEYFHCIMHCIFTFLFIFNLDHFDKMKTMAGHSIIGFGGDYDGVGRVPEGLEDVFKYPALVAELLSRGWTDAEMKATLGDREVECEYDNDFPIPYEEVKNDYRTSYGYPVPTQTVLGQFSPSALCTWQFLSYLQS